MGFAAVLLATLQLLLQSVLNIIVAVVYLIGSVACCKKSRRLRPKTILITGATAGIGRALALEYATSGVRLVLTGRNEARLAEVANECDAKGADVVAHKLDVSDEKACEKFILDEDDRENIDLVIANAGVSEATAGDDVARDIVKATRTLFSINVNGVFNTVLPLIERMKERRTGQIAIMSSMSGFGSFPMMTAYAASKSAVKAWGSGLRGLLHRYNIYVSVIMPAYVKSDMTDKSKLPKPFMWSQKKAAKYIRYNLEIDTETIIFPWPVHMFVWFLQSLPVAVKEFLGRTGLVGELKYFRKRKSDYEAEKAARAAREKKDI